jgi:hypothetical protein
MHLESFTRVIDLCLEEVMLTGNFSLMGLTGGVMVSYVCPVEQGQIEIQAHVYDESVATDVEVWCKESSGIQTYTKTELTELIDVLQSKKDKLVSQKPASLK